MLETLTSSLIGLFPSTNAANMSPKTAFFQSLKHCPPPSLLPLFSRRDSFAHSSLPVSTTAIVASTVHLPKLSKKAEICPKILPLDFSHPPKPMSASLLFFITVTGSKSVSTSISKHLIITYKTRLSSSTATIHPALPGKWWCQPLVLFAPGLTTAPWGERAFSIAAPTIPKPPKLIRDFPSLSVFKKYLKTRAVCWTAPGLPTYHMYRSLCFAVVLCLWVSRKALYKSNVLLLLLSIPFAVM